MDRGYPSHFRPGGTNFGHNLGDLCLHHSAVGLVFEVSDPLTILRVITDRPQEQNYRPRRWHRHRRDKTCGLYFPFGDLDEIISRQRRTTHPSIESTRARHYLSTRRPTPRPGVPMAGGCTTPHPGATSHPGVRGGRQPPVPASPATPPTGTNALLANRRSRHCLGPDRSGIRFGGLPPARRHRASAERGRRTGRNADHHR